MLELIAFVLGVRVQLQVLFNGVGARSNGRHGSGRVGLSPKMGAL
jgi:hypothetical protein